MLAARLRVLLPAVWAGVLLAIGVLAAPAAFATLLHTDAGRIAARLFQMEADLSIGVAVLLVMLERSVAQARSEAGLGSALSTELLLLLGTLFCTVAGYFALQPMMAAARAGQGPLSFTVLHGVSASFYGLKTLLVLVLAWRAAQPAAMRPSS